MVQWFKTSKQSDLVIASGNDCEDTPPEKATCAIVGTVSPTRLYLEPHGNYNPNFEKNTLETSKMQFQLTSPDGHPEFEADFLRGLKNLEVIQKKAIKEGPGAEHFIVADGMKRALKFSWPIFERRVRSLYFCIP